MGRKVLFAVVCCLTLSQTFGDKKTISLAIDNESAESAPRLYRNVPHGVYASASPYAAYSFHLPTFIAAPKTAASQVVPVRQSYVNHLTDSYGNKYVGTPQLSSYKLAFPQQFIPLQAKLPEHLAQPLVAASANFQFKQSNGQFFGAPYRVPAGLQGPAPTPLHHFPTFGRLYGDNLKNLAPGTVVHSQAFGVPNAHQQPSNNKAVLIQHYGNYKNDQKPKKEETQIIVGKTKVQSIQEIPHEPHGVTNFQRIQEAPHSSHGEPAFQRIQEAPHSSHSEPTFQRIQEASHSYHDEPKLKPQESHHSHEVDYEKLEELPHYEHKFQIIQEQPHSSQYKKIQEHRPSHGEAKFQRIQDSPSTTHTQHSYEHSQEKPQQIRQAENLHNNKAKIQTSPGKQTITYINDINGEKTIVELDTKPALPLLDITLLEPLTFENPLVPQVQHFLPRINQATYQKLPELALSKPSVKNYQKEFVVEKTTSYDSGHKPQKESSKKKQKKPTQTNKYPKKNEAPKKTYHETLDDAPEISYEINSPNYRETVKEKSLNYNRNTQSEPVHYTYGSKSENEPVTYSYARSSNQPAQIQSVHYQGPGNGPQTLIYKLSPQEQAHEHKLHNTAQHRSEAELVKESSHEADDDGPSYHRHHDHTEEYKEHPKSAEEHHEPAHQEKENYHKHNEEKHEEIEHERPPQYKAETVHIEPENINFQPILKEYENNIRLLTPSASIKVDPHQHIQPQSTAQPHANHGEELSQPLNQHPHSSPAPQHHQSLAPQGHHHSSGPQDHHHSSAPSQEQRHSSDAPHGHHPTSDAPRGHHHPSDAPHGHHHSSDAPHGHHHSSDAPHGHHHSSAGPREHHHSSPDHHEHHNSSPDHQDHHHHSSHAPQKQQPHPTHAPQEQSHHAPESHSHYHHHPHSETYNIPATIHEKSKRIIIQEEAPDEMHMLREQMRQEVIKREENSEEDFEKAYQDAALGFPAYSQKASDPEKDIFDPESYGIPRDHVSYDFENTPFQQYQAEGDEFPKESRSRYKDARDKMKQSYYTDFSVSKPEGLLDRYQNKLGYYKLFKEQKPEYLVDFEEDDKKQKQKSAKLILAPSFEFHTPQGKAKSYYGQPKQKQQLYEYDYSKGTPRDNSAFASRPYQSYKRRTSFVEPQFQYGFEPVSIPKLLDSELAAMASNDSPESEKPGMRKKIYKENWYIKKTSTSAGAPSS